jgi:hypothetical protein
MNDELLAYPFEYASSKKSGSFHTKLLTKNNQYLQTANY